MGDPNNIKHPVHYPQVKSGDIESENFEWFKSNDNASNNEALEPITQAKTFLQPLTRHNKIETT